MKGKILIALVPLLLLAGLLVLPVLAVPVYPNVIACGWALEKTCYGCVSGCATLYVAVGIATDHAVPAFDTLPGGFVILYLQCYAFEWQICQSSVNEKCNVLTFWAYPFSPIEGTVVPASVPSYQFVTPLSPIFVTIDLCKPYCVSATGCSTLFSGTGHTVVPP